MFLTAFRAVGLKIGRAIRAVASPRRRAVMISSELMIHDLGRDFDGYTIVAIADLHHSPGEDLAWLRYAVDTANAISPDVVALLGDYGESFKHLPVQSQRWYHNLMLEMTPELVRLRARDGVVAVLGNHDYYAGASAVTEWLKSLEIDVLVNGSRCVLRSQSALRITGLDDVREGRPDPRLGSSVANGAPPTIVLSHNPDGVLHLDPESRVDAVLAGHTHGGQIVLPGWGAPVTMARTCGRKSASGWVTNPRAPLFVTRGLGEQLPIPMRINCPPEMLMLRLRSANQQPA